ncbi:right-handed parallel beta-helix repeat-containing protein [Herbiconiux sp. YIM B11900]|uniref:right-handed parallel beta-helix repeat-containing protein n=1 Tax=Herbiconiux sp. YIM B11900 TaxID=3404131 RepID=UPI003F86A533
MRASEERGERDGGLTAEERGDTIGGGRRFAIRLVVAVMIVAGLGATVAVSNGVPARVSAFLGGIGSGLDGLLPEAPDAAPAAAPAPAATATGEADAVVAAGAAGVAPEPADAAAASATSAATAAVTPVSGDAAAILALREAEAAARPSSTLAPYPVDADEQKQGDLVQANDARWALIARGGALDAAAAGTVVVLGAKPGAYTLADLVSLGAVTRVDDRTLLMGKTVFVARGAELDLDGAGLTLRMASGAGGFAPLVVWGGVLRITGAEAAPIAFTSWDEAAGAADTDLRDGRAYIRVHEGTVATDYADFADLGFYSGRTGGFALTGSSVMAATGTIAHSTFSDLHIGLYLARAQDVVVSDSTIRNAARQGIEIGGGTVGTAITGSTVIGSGSSGVNVRQGAGEVSISGSTLTRSGSYGLRFDGSPRADGENSAGYPVENSWGLSVTDSTLSANASGGAWVSTVGSVVFAGNEVSQKTVGLYLRDSQSEVTGNTIAVDPGDGIVFEGPHTSARAEGNTLTGAGPSAIAQRDGADDVTALSNTDSGWTERWEVLLWIEAHPLALLWGMLLIIPVVGIAFVFYRARRQRRIRDLVESATIALAQAEKQKYERARVGAVSALDADVDVDADADVRVATAVGVNADMGVAAAVGVNADADVAAAVAVSADVGLVPDAVTSRTPEVAAVGSAPAPAVSSSPRVAVGGRGRPASPSGGSPTASALGSGSAGGSASTLGSGSALDSASAPGSGSAGGSGSAAGSPVTPLSPTRGVPPKRALPAVARAAAGAGARAAAVDPRPASSSASYGRFSSVEELAVAAVLDAGKPIDRVAGALRVPVGAVAGWVSKARRQREQDALRGRGD